MSKDNWDENLERDTFVGQGDQMPRADVEQGAQAIAAALRRTHFWHANFRTMAKVAAANNVGTNIGTWLFYGQAQPKPVGQQGDVVVTAPVKTSLHLIFASQIPTSKKKVILAKAVFLRVLQLLGAPKEAVVQTSDPTKTERDRGEAGVLWAPTRDAIIDTRQVDDYHGIKVPLSMSAMWPYVPKG